MRIEREDGNEEPLVFAVCNSRKKEIHIIYYNKQTMRHVGLIITGYRKC